MHSEAGLVLALPLDLAGQTQPQIGGDRRLLRTHMFYILFQIGVGLRGKRFEQGAVDIAFEDRRMNVAAPADRRRVAEMLRYLLDGAHDRLLPLALGIEIAETPQRLRRELRAGPGAEVLCRDILPRDLDTESKRKK